MNRIVPFLFILAVFMSWPLFAFSFTQESGINANSGTTSAGIETTFGSNEMTSASNETSPASNEMTSASNETTSSSRDATSADIEAKSEKIKATPPITNKIQGIPAYYFASKAQMEKNSSAAREEKRNQVDTLYLRVDYMHLENSTPRLYFEVELGIWRRIHEERIRQGVTNAWYFYSVMPGHRDFGDDPYEYLTISVFDSKEKMDDPRLTEASFDVYPDTELQELYDQADGVRTLIRTDVWKVLEVVSPRGYRKPVSEYLTFNFFDTRGHGGEHIEMETAFWTGIHKERVRRGILNGGILLVLDNQEGRHREYDYSTIDYYDDLTHLRHSVDMDLARSAHPDMPEAEIWDWFERTPKIRSVFKSELWRLVDYIEGPVSP